MTHINLLRRDACMDCSGTDNCIGEIWECGGDRALAGLDHEDLCN